MGQCTLVSWLSLLTQSNLLIGTSFLFCQQRMGKIVSASPPILEAVLSQCPLSLPYFVPLLSLALS